MKLALTPSPSQVLPIGAAHERISFSATQGLPIIDVCFTACRLYEGGFHIDICDFSQQTIDRWSVPEVPLDRAVAAIERSICSKRYPDKKSCHLKDLSAIHVAHLSGDGQIIAPRGNFYNGSCAYVIDTNTGEAGISIDDYEDDLNFYSATGGFMPNGRQWLYVRWPFLDTFAILEGHHCKARCELCVLDLETYQSTVLYELENDDKVHQVTASPDGRYVIFACIQNDLHTPYPNATIEQDPDGFSRSHESGIKLQNVVTIDLHTQQHWLTQIPVPVPSHMEFDPHEPDVFYISAHNVASYDSTTVMLEGPAAICKLRIKPGRTTVEDIYCEQDFFRVTQHVPFEYGGRTLIAVTNDPNKLELIDAKTMTLWRRAEMFDAPAIDFSRTGNAVSPTYPKTCRSINPSQDGKYIVLESTTAFFVYSVEEDRFLDIEMPRFLTETSRGTGHTRLAGR